MYNIEGTAYVNRIIAQHIGELRGKRVLELGNQHIWVHAKIHFGIPHDVAADWYRSRGAEYVSVDLNGEDGARRLDLATDLQNTGLDDWADLVTNIGTSEHVTPLAGQYWCFANVHRFCRAGGIMLHQLPPKGQWLDHCHIRYDERVLQVLAGMNRYGVLDISRTNLSSLGGHADYLNGVFRKMEAVPFSPDSERLLWTIEET